MEKKLSYHELALKVKELEKRVHVLESSNGLLEIIFANIPVGIQVFDKKGFSQKINNKQKELLGLPDLEEGIGKFNVLTDPYSIENGINQIYKKAFAGEAFSLEKEYNFDVPGNKWKTRKGKLLYSEQIIPITDSGQHITNVISILQDITEKKEAEKKLIQSEENLRTFFNTITDFLFVLNEGGEIISANKTVYDRLLYSQKELVGQSVLMVHPKERRDEAARIVQDMLTGKAEFCPIPLITKKGKYIPVETRVIKGVWNGVPALFGVSKDISELRLSEEKFSKYFHITPLISAISEVETGLYLEVNNAFLERLGYKRKEVIGKTSTDLGIIDPMTRKQVISKLRRKGMIGGDEVKMICKNGKVLDAILFIEKIFVQNKQYLITLAIDITEQKISEQKIIENEKHLKIQNNELEKLNDEITQTTLMLQENIIDLQVAKDMVEENELKFRRLFNSAPDPVFIVEKGSGVIVDVNDKVIEKYGYSINELVGKPTTVVSAEPEDTRLFSQNPDHNIPLRYHITKNGEVFPVEISVSIIQMQNKDYFIANVHDITERIKSEQILKESEQRFRSIFDNAISGIAFSDNNQKLIVTNQALDRMFGYEKGELIGLNINDLLHPEELPISIIIGPNQAGNDPSGYKLERRCVTKQKIVIWIDISGSVIKDIEGNPKYFVGVVNDITERKNTENQLRELTATKERLFSIIAHDLKNPFNAILGMSSLLVENIENDNYKEVLTYSKIINSATHQSLTLLENLLDWSRSQSGTLSFKPVTLDFQLLLKETLALLENSAFQKRIVIKYFVESNLKVHADKNMISTVIRNLVSNAIKYCHPDKLITITALTHKKMLKFSIEDQGVGIPEDLIAELFSVKGHVQTPGTNNEKGTGLGLILCKEFIERHNGEIWVESEVNKGTTFYFTIPKL